MYLSNYMKGYVVIIQAAEHWHTKPILKGIIDQPRDLTSPITCESVIDASGKPMSCDHHLRI